MEREIEFFHEALEREPSKRIAFVEAKHGNDPELVRRLIRLLQAHTRAEQATETSFGKMHGMPIESGPEWIGPYRVLELIGEGGMGVVYAAEQSEPFRRRVAIKVIKLGMDTREVIARFEAERQALAMMDHPGVAKAFDAGVTDQGRPFFVMELVKGLPLGEYCATHRLSLEDRLRLFVDICAAIQHAHQKGIIHRDLKPSNILVSVQEGRAVPKVIDFGVAKATAARLTERTLFTEQGRLIGTPEYMSPEQAEMSSLDIDTRTDVYSLGVILYELLTGVLPFDPKELRSGGYTEVLRIIREVHPPRPSTRLTELNRTPAEQRRDTGIAARSVRGELDWIVMRAMEKDRTRRYASASALGDDVERYLADMPVSAGPPSLTYGIKKFVKRHRFVTGLMGLVALSTVAGITGLALGLVRAENAKELAKRRADNAQATARFLQRVLFRADPEHGGGSLTLTEAMASADALIEEDLAKFPEVEASVRESLGVAFRRRSMFREAYPHLRRSLQLRQRLLGDDHLATARSFIAMGGLRSEFEGDVDEARTLFARALHSYEVHDKTDSTADAWLQLDIGLVELVGDHLVEARRAFERCRDLLGKDRGLEHPDISRPIRGLATIALLSGDHAEAERLARQAVALCQGENEDYIGGRAALVLARVLLQTERLGDAEHVLTQVRKQFIRTVGEQHIRIAELDADLCQLHLRRAEFVQASAIAERCETMRRRILHKNHWGILEAQLLRQRARAGLGDAEAADNELRQISTAVAQRLGPDHPLTIRVAQARLECAEARADVDLTKIRTERLAALRSRRAERLRGEQ